MLFIILFTICLLAIPIAFEIHKHGKNNILTRAYRELKEIYQTRASKN